MSNTETNAIDIKHNLVQAEQVRLLYAAMPLSILAIIINSAILVIFQWNVISHFILLLWGSILLVITVVRGIIVRAYFNSETKIEKAKQWLDVFSVGVVLSALVWGGSVVWLFPEQGAGHQVLVAFVIAGMSAGATTSLSYRKNLVSIFLLFTLMPLSIRFFLLGDNVSVAMGIMSLVFFIMMLMVGRRNYKNIKENISLQIEAVTREKKLRESEEKYRHIFSSSPLGIVHYDKNTVVTDFNSNFLELIGVQSCEIKNINLIENSDDEKLIDAMRQSLSGALSTYEGMSNALFGNNEVCVRVFFRGMFTDEGDISGGVAILEDISEEKRIKKLKDEFISTISHELRTPLTAIKGAIGLLQGGALGEVSEPAHNMLDITGSNTERLLFLINDILDIEKIESGTMVFDMQAVDVMALLQEAVDATKLYARQYNVDFEITQGISNVYIWGDYRRLMQVMYNLLSNAAKFSPQDTTVNISATKNNEYTTIAVTDYGSGIPEDFQAKIFERFSQADATDSRKTGGTGLGLSITKGIMEKHKGEISFTSSKKGSTFYIKLKNYREEVSHKGNTLNVKMEQQNQSGLSGRKVDG